jgi:hypothetical protein
MLRSNRPILVGRTRRHRVRKPTLYRTIQMIMSSSYQNSSIKLVPELDSRGASTARPATDRLAMGSVVGEHPGDLNETGTDAGSVLTAELTGSAPPQADCIVR